MFSWSHVSVAPKVVAGPRDTAALVNSDVRLTCAAVGDPSPVISWLKDGDPVIPSDYFQLVDGGSLRILGLVASDAGMYQCMAGNTAGSTQATAQLVVLMNGTLKNTYTYLITTRSFIISGPLYHITIYLKVCPRIVKGSTVVSSPVMIIRTV